MAKLVLICLFFSQLCFAKVEVINTFEIPFDQKFKKTTIGGLSGLYFDGATNSLFAVSDDRGRRGDPRFYEFKIENKKGKYSVTPSEVILLSARERKFWNILDLEGIAKLPWGSFVFSSEGDLNQIPRQQPQLIDSKIDGKLVREWEVPDKFLAEKTGKQTKGIRNNNGWEGLSVSPDGKKILVATEAALIQDSDVPFSVARFVQYESPDAWLLKPTVEFAYKLELPQKRDMELELGNGISEILFEDNSTLLVMERSLGAKAKAELSFHVKIFKVSLKDAKDVSKNESFMKSTPPTLPKELFFDFDSVTSELGGKIYNFEGMAWGPSLPDGGRLLILVADNNFRKAQKTQFVFLKVK